MEINVDDKLEDLALDYDSDQEIEDLAFYRNSYETQLTFVFSFSYFIYIEQERHQRAHQPPINHRLK